MVAYCLLEEPKTCRWFLAVATLFVEGHVPKKKFRGGVLFEFSKKYPWRSKNPLSLCRCPVEYFSSMTDIECLDFCYQREWKNKFNLVVGCPKICFKQILNFETINYSHYSLNSDKAKESSCLLMARFNQVDVSQIDDWFQLKTNSWTEKWEELDPRSWKRRYTSARKMPQKGPEQELWAERMVASFWCLC